MIDLRDTSLPLPLRWLIAHDITSLTPWHLLADRERAAALRAEYCAETQGRRDCLPFGVRHDSDNVAAFVVSNGEVTHTVIDVHLTYSRNGMPSEKRYDSFWAWFKSAIDDSAGFASELSIDEILEEGLPPVIGGFDVDQDDEA